MVLSCMTDLSMDALKISKHPNEGAIKVRWRIKGIPLLTKMLPYIGRRLRDGEDCYRYTCEKYILVFIILLATLALGQRRFE